MKLYCNKFQDHNYGAPPPTSPPMSPNPDGTELAIEASACDGSNQFLNSTELNNGKVPIDSTGKVVLNIFCFLMLSAC